MRFFICALILAVAAVSIRAQDTAADTEANKVIIKQLHDVLHDSSKTIEEKKAKVQETLQNLKGSIKNKIDSLLSDMKNSVASIQNPQAKEVAAKMQEMFENGELFDDKEKMEQQLSKLTPEAKEELHKLKIQYKQRIEQEFQQYKDLKPQ